MRIPVFKMLTFIGSLAVRSQPAAYGLALRAPEDQRRSAFSPACETRVKMTNYFINYGRLWRDNQIIIRDFNRRRIKRRVYIKKRKNTCATEKASCCAAPRLVTTRLRSHLPRQLKNILPIPGVLLSITINRG